MIRCLRAGLWYFTILFAIGWVLGPIRVLVLEPQFGALAALLIEAPVMIGAMIFVVRWLTTRMRIPYALVARLLMGTSALLLLLVAEVVAMRLVEGEPIVSYAEKFAGIEGIVTALLYAVFAVMPLLVNRR